MTVALLRRFRLTGEPGDYVARVRMRAQAAPASVEWFPNATTSILWRDLGDGRGDLSIAGPRTRALFKTTPPARRAILVQLEPATALPIVGTSMSALTDKIVRLQDLWGDDADRLLDAMLRSETSERALAELERALLDRASAAGESAAVALTQRALRLAAASEVPPTVEALAVELGVTSRHLRRVFHDALGVGPKTYGRMLRVNRAVALLDQDLRNVEVAARAGYYDESHFIAEFRTLVGFTPSAYSRRESRPRGW